jgi:hypothetical protein
MPLTNASKPAVEAALAAIDGTEARGSDGHAPVPVRS